MKAALIGVFLVVLLAAPVGAQSSATTEAQIRVLVPYATLAGDVPGLTLQEYDQAVRQLAETLSREQLTLELPQPAPQPKYLGRLGGNPYLPDSTSNPYGRYGNPYAPDSLTNSYGRYGNPYSPSSSTNPYATQTPRLFGQDGSYLGKVSTNPYDLNSVSNPFGRYGNPFSPDSINNPFSVYGNPFSPLSPFNPYTTTPPLILGR